LTLDVYTHAEMPENVEAQRAGDAIAEAIAEAIEKVENSGCLTSIQIKTAPDGVSEALAA
jgi:hypothetical protein